MIGNHGRGITINITDSEELLVAYKISKKVYKTSIVEKYLKGSDFRVLVIDGKFVAATYREPAFVVGNGKNTIKQLIEEINRDPQRGYGHENILTKITIDYMTERLLEDEGLTLQSIPERGRKIYVKSTANISSGATAKDVTDTVHTLNRLMAERISRIMGLNVMGIDIIANSLEIPLTNDNSGGVGNRREKDILQFGKSIADFYDYIIICDSDPRQRNLGETAKIVKDGLLQGGFEEDKITIILDEREATKAALDMAERGDLIVLQVDDVNQVIKDVLNYRENLSIQKFI